MAGWETSEEEMMELKRRGFLFGMLTGAAAAPVVAPALTGVAKALPVPNVSPDLVGASLTVCDASKTPLRVSNFSCSASAFWTLGND
jgi:hypothetical protein